MDRLPIQHLRGLGARELSGAVAALPRAGLRAALVGRSIGASRTPGMHNAEGRRLGLDYAYGRLDFDALGLPDSALGAVVAEAVRQGLAGLNVTHPFKQAIIAELDGLSEEAAAIGAVNTVVFAAGRATGHNTDGSGFAESFRREMAGAALDRVLLIGAGGAGKAVAWALLSLGAGRVAVTDAEPARASALAAALAEQWGSRRAVAAADLPAAAAEADGLVNATPVGMEKYPGMPMPAAALRPALWVADVVYFPERTALLGAAAALGCRTMGGRGMAIQQAVLAFRLITGAAPDPGAMARHFGDPPEAPD
jgi:shikimate dehydrogenase